MQRITALELKPGPKKCIVIVQCTHTCTMYHSRISLDMNETLNFECYSLGVILLQLNQYLQNFNKIPF